MFRSVPYSTRMNMTLNETQILANAFPNHIQLQQHVKNASIAFERALGEVLVCIMSTYLSIIYSVTCISVHQSLHSTVSVYGNHKQLISRSSCINSMVHYWHRHNQISSRVYVLYTRSSRIYLMTLIVFKLLRASIRVLYVHEYLYIYIIFR